MKSATNPPSNWARLKRLSKKVLSRDAQLSLEFLPLVASVRWQLWRTPFSKLHPTWRARVQNELDASLLRQKTEIEASSEASAPDRVTIDEVWRCAHAVARAARLVPFASCLTQAMTLQLVLAQRGQGCSVCLGVNKSSGRGGAPTTQESATLAESGLETSPDAGESSPNLASPPRFRAHAWVEWNGRVVLGGDVRRWRPLTIFAPVAPSASPNNASRRGAQLLEGDSPTASTSSA